MNKKDYRVYKVMNTKTKKYIIAASSLDREAFVARQLTVDTNTLRFYDKTITEKYLSVRVIKVLKNAEKKDAIAWGKTYRMKHMEDKLLLNKPYIPKKTVKKVVKKPVAKKKVVKPIAKKAKKSKK